MTDKETYSAKYVYARLGVSESTLRKWNQKLEEKGYSFNKNPKGDRLFTVNDIIVLERYKQLVQDQGVHQEIAANIILNITDPNISNMLEVISNAASGNDRLENTAQLSVIDGKIDTVIQAFTGIAEYIKRQDEWLILQEDRMIKQEEKMERIIQQNEELKIQIAASQEKEKPGWLAKLFRKKT